MSEVQYADDVSVRAYAARNRSYARCRRLGHIWLEAEDVVTLLKSRDPEDVAFARSLGLKKRSKDNGGGYDENIGCGRCRTVKTHILNNAYQRIDDGGIYDYPEEYELESGTGIIGRNERDILRAENYRALARAKRRPSSNAPKLSVVQQAAG